MRFLKMLIVISFGMLVAACGGGGGGGGATVTPADFSGTWTASEGGTTLLYSVVQTGSSFTMTRTSPALVGVTYTGAVSGNSALVTTYINNIQAATSTLTLVNDTTATMTVNTCTPPQGYTCAAPGSKVTVTRTSNQSTAPADFSGTWTANANGTVYEYSITQTGSSFNMTRTTPALAGVTYSGVVTGNSALVTTYINGTSSGTSTLALTSSTTATMTVNTCTPPPGYSCAAPGSTLVVTRTTIAAATNVAPVAAAGVAQSVDRGATVTLNGSGSSDANGDTLIYSWTLTSKPIGSIAPNVLTPSSPSPQFTADLAGTYVASLVVNDGQLSSTPATVTIYAKTPIFTSDCASCHTTQTAQTHMSSFVGDCATCHSPGRASFYHWF